MISESLSFEVGQLLDQPVKNMHSVSGGSINEAAKISTGNGQTYFLKWNNAAASDMFAKEQKGLALLKTAQSGLRIPDVIGTGATDDGTDFIIMEYIAEGSAGPHSAKRLARGLATLHHLTIEQYGLDHDNYIGRLPQSNTRHANWVDFFVDERLQPQLRMALDAGKLSPDIIQHFKRLYKKLPDILAHEPASLLHGDLWGGNYFFDAEGNPVIYDPAVYYGNREIELAFTHLFGGFSSDFYDAYKQSYPLQPRFNERIDIYNLYPLLVHTNLFGASYARRVESIMQRF